MTMECWCDPNIDMGHTLKYSLESSLESTWGSSTIRHFACKKSNLGSCGGHKLGTLPSTNGNQHGNVQKSFQKMVICCKMSLFVHVKGWSKVSGSPQELMLPTDLGDGSRGIHLFDAVSMFKPILNSQYNHL